jgi:hypothetical protein
MREFPLSLCTLQLLAFKQQTLLLRRFDRTRDIVSHPLESFSTREPQPPLCQVRCKQSSTPNAR